MKSKHILLCGLGSALLALILALFFLTAPYKSLGAAGAPDALPFRTHEKSFQVQKDGKWKDFQPVGVNMGSGYPGAFPGEDAIDEETYLRWMKMIGAMHANTIRVYQLQPPGFYQALVTYNETHDHPLYLIQNVDFPDQLMYSEKDLMDSNTTRDLFSDTRTLVNAVHGDAVQLDLKNDRLLLYTADASPYLLAYNMGVEWDELFVDFVCRSDAGLPPYQGAHFSCTEDASPFESFLARWADFLLTCEQGKYNRDSLISFANWAETDPFLNEVQMLSLDRRITRPNQETTLDTNHIRPSQNNAAGMFTSYNIYPYFPTFLQYGPYAQFVDEDGKHNPYQGYLTDLAAHHTDPVLISEYGVPSCRSAAYKDIWRGISHGGLSETEQGRAIVELYRDIRASGCAGSLVFTWQDEWFKRAWNEMAISDPDKRSEWSNAQCAEQAFGLLAFDPGEEGSTIYPDGDLSDWDTTQPPLLTQGTTTLHMDSDERYLYFLIQGLPQNQDRVHLALDVTPKSGASSNGVHHFAHNVDFLVHLPRSGDGRLEVHAPYDLLVYSMADKLRASMSTYMIEDLTDIYFPDCGEPGYDQQFHLVTRACGSIQGMMRHRYEMEPAGLLHSGNANPSADTFNSNADICVRNSIAEIRIPWQLLNFRDPSSGVIVDDLQANDLHIQDLAIDEIHAALYFDGQTNVSNFSAYQLPHWKHPQWHERLKASYYILQEEFKGVKQP